ncbi:sigma-70 family RNA polymerase sigma factor [Amycolatopsis sp. H20-H5]|uniref:sigma-70 family RNA polymerase sigma factor n=1 Tax=Amycolatopsis sp. H20-H5 TaxID=3046309 RepID=UPI002DB94DF4|nr:sigma-70 family RNA polymerase sigma factor [Amycolatopsis sp. H20-H5]MEC3978903.1 sigma-70 family RNA polymerase sigma factor [Amycolatopsis sp. H20-H5]
MTAPTSQVRVYQDSELIEAVRHGDIAAYGGLYKRHVRAAYNLARQMTRSMAEQDDLVSEAFSKVLDVLREGRGPDSVFRAYLLTVLRHKAYDKTRNDRRVELTEDVTTTVNSVLIAVPFNDTVVAELERALASKAFTQLPERWQSVLWRTEIEGKSPSDIAPEFGLTANGISALAYRAREGLRQAYLQVHLSEASAKPCKPTIKLLGAWTRGGLTKRETLRVDEHLLVCESCHALSVELAAISSAFRLGGAAKSPCIRTASKRQTRGRQLSLTKESGHSSISMKLAS